MKDPHVWATTAVTPAGKCPHLINPIGPQRVLLWGSVHGAHPAIGGSCSDPTPCGSRLNSALWLFTVWPAPSPHPRPYERMDAWAKKMQQNPSLTWPRLWGLGQASEALRTSVFSSVEWGSEQHLFHGIVVNVSWEKYTQQMCDSISIPSTILILLLVSLAL